MNMTEHNEAQFTKEKSLIEKYLMRIIQRYFDTERNYTMESIEAMVMESLTRLKQDLLNNNKEFIFNLNGESGIVTLTIRKLGGEPAFEKNTAFNKDFGTEADTVCEGNDPRLYNEREPLDHVHEIADIEGLKEALESAGVLEQSHVHDNKTVLDMLRYTGNRTQIDLIELEYLEEKLRSYYENLQYLQRQEQSIHNEAIDHLAAIKDAILDMINRAQTIIDTAQSWIEKAKSYTDTQTVSMRNYYKSLLRNFVTEEQLKILQDFYSDTVQFITDGEIPLEDGECVLTQNEDTGTTAGNGDGDSLKAIYEQGIRMGNDDWQWDDDAQSFVYQHNEEQSYPLFLSLSKFQNYTHRVTLSSVDSDDDVIGVIIAYDEATGNHLSLLIAAGINSNKPQATIVLNYMESGYGSGYTIVPVATELQHIYTGVPTGWKNITNGVPVLIKREDNNIKIWVNYNQPHDWVVEDVDKHVDIIPTEEPLFDFELGSYPALQCFMDKECNYGYGNFSQPKATYLDVFFTSYSNYLEPFGETFIDQQTEAVYNVPQALIKDVQAGRTKMWFRYDKDGKTYQYPLPFMFPTINESWGVVQGTFNESGRIEISVHLMISVAGLITKANFYDNKHIIVPIVGTLYTTEETQALCFIDSANKNNFVKNLLSDGMEYWIQGISDDTGYWVNSDVQEMTFFDWDSNEPNFAGLSNCIYINANKKWAAAVRREKKGYVAEYVIKYLSEYFDNPRVYYQVYGQKEVK